MIRSKKSTLLQIVSVPEERVMTNCSLNGENYKTHPVQPNLTVIFGRFLFSFLLSDMHVQGDSLDNSTNKHSICTSIAILIHFYLTEIDC